MSAFFYKGNSMYRVFRNGDELFTEKPPFAELQPGDIICFRTPQTEAVVHRMIRRSAATQVTTQGDNNPLPDEPVDAEHYIGRVASFRRGKVTMPAINGRKGMRRFRINQAKRRLRAWLFELGRKNKGFFDLAPLRFCAGVFPPELARFGDQILAMRGKTVVAEKRSGKPWHVRGAWKAIYPPALLESLASKMDLTNRTTSMEELPVMKRQTALDNAVAAIKDGHYRLGTAESCTGGGIGALITALPGSSDFFVGGIIAYANRIKHDVLGVSNELLETRGAVSAECAEAMAEGAASLLHADVTVAVTGIAGPGGGSPEKPVGLVYIAARSPQRSIVRKFHFTGNRDDVREKTQTSALKLICELLSE